MASANQHYPDYLNPFGSDEEEDTCGQVATKRKTIIKHDDYPDYLSPFGEEDNDGGFGPNVTVDDYDDSLNPFGDDDAPSGEGKQEVSSTSPPASANHHEQLPNGGNPFGDDEEENEEQLDKPNKVEKKPKIDLQKPTSPHPESNEPPPVPLPRTKSLLKKEQARRNGHKHLASDTSQSPASPSTSSSSITITTNTTTSITATGTSTATATTTNTGSFQRKKNKRNAPPVPINFKRQVSGSLDAIEEELNDIGDKLANIEDGTNKCQEALKAVYQVNDAEFEKTRLEFVELIKRKNSTIRRQKELMYRKRELKLDQIHSDIEYELRMIGNKQLSHRTVEDETREKELLKKLVEIVEEKNDIVENLNKDTSCDTHDIEEALRRLNITNGSPPETETKSSVEDSSCVAVKNDNCDKSSRAIGNKLSKIATLLPKGGTIKGTMKIKRKRLFKKCASRQIER